jgi:translation initiation factor 2 subunit 2
VTLPDYEQMLRQAMAKIPHEVTERKRFRIPQAQVSIRGPKTILKNFGQLTAVLRRDARHVSKFLVKQLATAGWVQAGQLIFQGRISPSRIQAKINEYVSQYVMCQACRNPDTRLVRHDRITWLRCEACGSRYPARKL